MFLFVLKDEVFLSLGSVLFVASHFVVILGKRRKLVPRNQISYCPISRNEVVYLTLLDGRSVNCVYVRDSSSLSVNLIKVIVNWHAHAFLDILRCFLFFALQLCHSFSVVSWFYKVGTQQNKPPTSMYNWPINGYHIGFWPWHTGLQSVKSRSGGISEFRLWRRRIRNEMSSFLAILQWVRCSLPNADPEIHCWPSSISNNEIYYKGKADSRHRQVGQFRIDCPSPTTKRMTAMVHFVLLGSACFSVSLLASVGHLNKWILKS